MQAKNQQSGKPPDNPAEAYKVARVSLLMMAVLTALNAVLYVLRSAAPFAFSAIMPNELFKLGGFGVAAGIACIAAYFALWLLSKKHYAWMIAAAVLFLADCGFLVYAAAVSEGREMITYFLLDFVFHLWVMISLINGIINGVRLQRSHEGTVHDATEPADTP